MSRREPNRGFIFAMFLVAGCIITSVVKSIVIGVVASKEIAAGHKVALEL